jgi:hypothetical protein
MIDHFPLHGIELLLNSGPYGSDTVMQQDDAPREFMWMIVLYVGVQLSKRTRLMVCTDCVIT